jgi:hypothetical protein
VVDERVPHVPGEAVEDFAPIDGRVPELGEQLT